MEAYLYADMFKLEQNHWWFAAKHRIVLSMLQRALPARSGKLKVADLGCGCGRMLQLLSQQYEAVGVDVSPLAVEFAKKRNVKVVEGRLPNDVPLTPGTFDAVLMLDVLEHLDDDVDSAAAAAKLLKPGGIFLLTVPAYQWLFGPHDVAHHHRQRYTRGQLELVLREAALEVKYSSYCNTILFPLALAQRAAQRSKKHQPAQISTSIPPRPINAMFRAVFASERHLLGRVALPFGLSVVAMATPLRR